MAEFPRLKTEFDGIRCELVKAGRGHRYRVDGEIDLMVSVTTHLGIIDKSGGLLGAAQKRIGERIQERLLAVEKGNAPGEDNYQAYLEEVIAWAKANVWGTAAEDGTAAHAMIAAHYGETAPPDLEDDVVARIELAVKTAKAIVKEDHLDILAVEYPIYHPRYKYAGTIDGVIRDSDGMLRVLDWKRSSGIFPEYEYQVAAYGYALAEHLAYPEPIGGVVVKLPQTNKDAPEVKYLSPELMEAGFRCYRDAQRLYESTHTYPKR